MAPDQTRKDTALSAALARIAELRHETIQTDTGTFSVSVPNTVLDGDGFYVSYNDHDIGIYGSETTALVVGQMRKFYILKGDHRAQYQPLVPKGLDACLSYYRQNPDLAHRSSDKLEAVSADQELEDEPGAPAPGR